MRTLTLRQLRSVQAIDRHGTIAAAARNIGLSAPAVTLQIQQLEDEFGLLLFDRTSEGMHLREAGRAVLDAANAIETVLRGLGDEIGAIKGLGQGSMRLGVVSTAKYFAPRLIAAFRRDHPGIEIRLVVGNRSEIIDGLRSYRLDLTLMGRPPLDVPVAATAFGDHPFVMIAAPDHPLATRRDIGRAELLESPLIIREPGSGTRKALESFFAALPDALDRDTMEMDSNETIKQAVMAGLGIAFLSAHTVAFEVEMGRLAILDVADMPIRRQWFAVARTDRVASPAEVAFKAFLAQRGASFLPLLDRLYPAGGMKPG